MPTLFTSCSAVTAPENTKNIYLNSIDCSRVGFASLLTPFIVKIFGASRESIPRQFFKESLPVGMSSRGGGGGGGGGGRGG